MSLQVEVIQHEPVELPFPHFLCPLTLGKLVPFSKYDCKGAWITVGDKQGAFTVAAMSTHSYLGKDDNVAPAHDWQGLPLVEMERSYIGIHHNFEEREQHRKLKRRAANDRKRNNPVLGTNTGLTTAPPNPPNPPKQKSRLRAEDCWKIGDPQEKWEEPAGACRYLFDASAPPFSRLILATADFIRTRDAELQYRKNKRLFDIIRDQFGVRKAFAGNHWSGSGPHGSSYLWKRCRFDRGLAPALLPSQRTGQMGRWPRLDEACVLLREPINSVRRFLKLARKESESAWDIAPALKLATILSAYLSYLVYHNVFPEPELHQSFRKAAKIARTGITKLLDAKRLEDVLTSRDGWNRACWAIWGGPHSGAEPGGPEREAISWGLPIDFTDTSSKDQEWIVEPVNDTRPEPSSADEVKPVLESLVTPIPIAEITLLKSIPFSHRIIIAVLPPLPTALGVPAFESKCYRLVTIPSPEKLDTQWIVHSGQFDDDEDSVDGFKHGDDSNEDLTVIEEPEELQIWVDEELFKNSGSEQLVGMGLQGRWGLMGTGNNPIKHRQWWVFKTRDFVLPAV
nr:hypothetical protein L204_06022 [Cryptococcus depauperatus CBS 7855]